MKQLILAACAALALAGQACAGALVPVELAPIKHARAALVIVAPDGTEIMYSPADLEQFDTYSLTTTTPWRETPARFEGVLLADVLAAHDMQNVGSIAVTAENDYRTSIERDLFSSVDILVATRVDGAAHNRRNRGPIQFVIDADAFAASPLTSQSNFVWMAARIEMEQ